MTIGQAQTLAQVLAERARISPNEVCERHKRLGIWHEFTWAQVHDNVRALALGLQALGVRRDGVVMAIGENEPEHFWTEFAAHALGAAVVSLYPDQNTDEITYLAQDSGATVVVAQDQEQVDKALVAASRASTVEAIVYWDDAGLWNYSDALLHSFEEVQRSGREVHASDTNRYDAELAMGRADDVAVLSYTSGTTGLPKGVILTQRYLFDNAARITGALAFKPGCEYLTYISPAWATEQFFGITLGLMVPMVVNFPEGPEQVLANLRELAVEAMLFSPRQWENLASVVQARMLDAGTVRRAIYQWGVAIGHEVNVGRLEGRQPSLAARLMYPLADALVLEPLRDKLGLVRAQITLCGGSAMAPDVFRLFHAMGVHLRNAYGTTEIGLLTLHQGERYNLETVGHWMKCDPQYGPPLEWRVSDEGELQVKGGSGFIGYHGKPDKTAESLDGDWYRTGDAVSLTEGGELVFLERVKDMRRLRGGHPFPPQFIETRLRFSPFIKDLMTLGDDKRDFVAALINIDMEVVGRWAEERNIGFSTFADLSQRPEVRELIRAEIARINALLPRHARVSRFANFPKELDPDEGELTRSRKLRRDFLEERYAKLIDGLYAGEATIAIVVPVTYQDGRKGTLSANVTTTQVNDGDSATPQTGHRATATEGVQ
ncbi:MAG: AMP-binding protein [Burkholderiaceae bacterium]|nr:AMP-binding protein [Burkholderiaceae bacterium]